MTFPKILILMFGLAFPLIFIGCGAKPDDEKNLQAKSEDKRIQSFTNNFQIAEAEYAVSFTLTGTIIQKAAEIAKGYNSDEEREKSVNDYLTGWNGLDPAASDFSKIFTNAQNSIDYITKADQDFQYIYTTYKELPPSVKDDFYIMKDLINDNITFIRAFRRGELHKDNFQEWMDNDKKINNSYRSVLLEVERIQK
jgi:hypothetical protein